MPWLASASPSSRAETATAVLLTLGPSLSAEAHDVPAPSAAPTESSHASACTMTGASSSVPATTSAETAKAVESTSETQSAGAELDSCAGNPAPSHCCAAR